MTGGRREILTSGSTRGEDVVPSGIASSPTLRTNAVQIPGAGILPAPRGHSRALDLAACLTVRVALAMRERGAPRQAGARHPRYELGLAPRQCRCSNHPHLSQQTQRTRAAERSYQGVPRLVTLCTQSPTLMMPPVRICARRPPRWVSPRITSVRISRSRCAHGSHSLRPRRVASPI